jgi:hypothetical protein
MRRRAIASHICFDFECPICKKPWGAGHVGVTLIGTRSNKERLLFQEKHVKTPICRYCARAIGKVDVE